MPSFLEQINNNAGENADKASAAAQDADINDTGDAADADPGCAEDDTFSGIRSTEHETEVDRGFFKKRSRISRDELPRKWKNGRPNAD